ncbi:MAG: putative glycosidase ph1107 protein [Parcubacteria group bacterium Gr01-1014_56]|nr:MAG: putative glycosidase ph1107 protein [Parcubacteria group bacterium Gr01-1014_56]
MVDVLSGIIIAAVAISDLSVFLAFAAIALGFLLLFFFWFHDVKKLLVLHRLKENPILSPISEHWWESYAVFNPAALYDQGRVHLFYRAMGQDGVSRIGYASSPDGIHFDERLPSPVYSSPVEMIRSAAAHIVGRNTISYATLSYDTASYGSGGGWGGSEDPKTSKMGDRIYMTYVNNNGWSDLRIALTSISLADFRAKRWNWTAPVFVSRRQEKRSSIKRFDIVNKSGVLLEEQINNKYIIFHRIFPNISIDYRDTLEFGEGMYVEEHAAIPPRYDMWDNEKISMSSAPVRVPEGWLAIFNGTDARDSKYKIGAMILDADDPSRVLYRSNQPILSPETHYENSGKSGIAYSSGAVVVGDDLIVYYGGGDKYVAAAKANLRDFLRKLSRGEHAVLTPVGR